MAENYTLQIKEGVPCLAWSFFETQAPEQVTYYYRLAGPVKPEKRGQLLVPVSHGRVKDEDGTIWSLEIREGDTEALPAFIETKPIEPPRAIKTKWEGGSWHIYHPKRGWRRVSEW